MKKKEEFYYNADYQRIIELKKYFGFHTWVEFAKNIGLGHAQIFSDIKKNSCGISDSLAKRIVEYAPNISYEWLKTGNGDMIVSGDGNNVNQVSDNNRSNITTVDDRLIKLIESAMDALKETNDTLKETNKVISATNNEQTKQISELIKIISNKNTI